MVSQLSEDIIIFNALSPNITNLEILNDALQEFFDLKKSLDLSDRYNFILFDQKGPNFLNDFTLNPGKVLSALRTLKSNLVIANVAGGIFAALTLIIDVFKKVPEKCYRLIILTDSSSLQIPTPYLLELQKLVDKIYTFPFFIDIVRFNIDDTEEDKKLMSLARRCNGEIHEINSMDSLSDILSVLAIKREIISDSMARTGNIHIPKENYTFFNNLGENLIPIDQGEQCTICFKKNNKEKIQCPNCLSIGHKKCYAVWARKSNIGLSHIFRCHHCYYLLKLDEEYVRTVQSEKKKSKVKPKVKKVGFQKFLEKYELEYNPDLNHMQDPLGIVVLKQSFETVPSRLIKEVESYRHSKNRFSESNNKIPVAVQNPNVKMIICQNCGKVLTNSYTECPKCHFPL